MVSSAPSDDGEMVQRSAGPLSRMQEIAGFYQGQDDPYVNVAKNRLPSAFWEEAKNEDNFNAMLLDNLLGTAQVKKPPSKKPNTGGGKHRPTAPAKKTVVDPKKKKLCKNQALSKGFSTLSPACKKMLKTDVMLCQIQAN